MRYAVFSDIHANLEALEAVLAKIDEISKEKPIDQIWFLGDLVGYGPDPNACISLLRERTDVIIAGNHDWAAVNKIDLDDFSAAARISAEWTAQQLTEEHREFLANLPERLDIGDVTLVHGSPYGPLWEYLTSEVLAERSFQYFSSRFCFVGHTHIPVIFQQPMSVNKADSSGASGERAQETAFAATAAEADESSTGNSGSERSAPASLGEGESLDLTEEEAAEEMQEAVTKTAAPATTREAASVEQASADEQTPRTEPNELEQEGEYADIVAALEAIESRTSEEKIVSAEDRLNSEIEELLALLGLSQSMIKVTNEMLTPPEGHWDPPAGYRAIINPGGVGQPRDGDPRAAFMIYDTEAGFEFYRVPYDIKKTQEKIIKAGLPQYLAIRLAYGR
ncbi:MAG: metallophosphoesterase family protein [Thermogemmatispora sp.]|uniref:metallophosphoesterase family protein n=1 Tax=Thermogemmatispora sp. TaxID=1968838 RepID=UPI0026082F84|nr:metallophosphoesterase family protein [Thermogemmatispora sp.]MBX5455882.1 metallophosphoesterase family protein [Thermogemmatispora sp.]